ncbi:MAG TPA: class I SAM-dependent methyltransferase [Candidatus Binataceae bacterium]
MPKNSAHEPSTYGERIAEIYDRFYGAREDAGQAADFLLALAKGRRVLELGIGTGRIAIPLKQRGVRLDGIDASPAMVEKLRAKAEGLDIPVTIGNFADLKIAGRFSLIYVVFNTLFMLTTQQEQLRCFQRVARRLAADGAFVVEAFMPNHWLLAHEGRTATADVGNDHALVDAIVHQSHRQHLNVQHMLITSKGVQLFPIQLRYCYPAELDLMAQLAGMRLRERFGGWNREPFTAQSGGHVSVYELAPVKASGDLKAVKAEKKQARRKRS